MRLYKVPLMALLGIFLGACEAKESVESKAVNTYSSIVLASYTDTYNDALAMQKVIETFINAPSAQTLEAAKEAWITARASYGKTEAFRFYGGPIDDQDGPEGQLNAWPLDESYIDYVAEGTGVVNTNIINSPDEFPTISADMIAELNENGSEVNVSSGYHAIEFLLWGQDLSDGPGGGERPYTDYVIGERENADRRALYLHEVTALLVSDLASLIEEWDTNGDNYRSNFTANPKASIGKIISGLGKLSKGELSGERMFVAYDLRSKEDEHSCFSDNTHNDIVNNAIGIRNVYMGTYTQTNDSTIAGTGIYDVVAKANPELADEIKSLMNESLEACKKIEAPFDQEFLRPEGRQRIQKAIMLLRKQGDKLAEAAEALGFEFDPSAI